MSKSTGKTAEERKAEADALHQRLVEQIETLRNSQAWTTFLRAAAAFHSYSLSNVLLILAQDPEATTVAGFRQWQARGRQVRKGERSIKILGYSTKTITHTDAETGEETEQKLTRYPILSVFDRAQTDPIDGHDEPRLTSPVTGEDETGLWEAMSAHLQTNGWTIEREQLGGLKNGSTNAAQRRIVVGTHLDGAHAARCLLHEAAHATLHHDLDPAEYQQHRGTYETEAESVAYVLAGLAGLDTSAYSVGYVAGWSQADTSLIRSTADNVMRAVHILAPALTTS